MKRLLILCACALASVLTLQAKDRLLVLPSIQYSMSPAVVNGTFVDYQSSGTADKVAFYYLPIGENSADSVVVPVDNNGTFRAEINVNYTCRVTVHLNNGNSFVVVLLPGETIDMKVDLKHLGDAEYKKPAVTFTGTLADFNTDLVKYGQNGGEYETMKMLEPIQGDNLKTLKGYTPVQYKQRLLQLYEESCRKLNADKRLCGAYKQYVEASYEYMVLQMALMYRSNLKVANEVEEYNEEAPEGYYMFLKEWQPFSSDAIVYAIEPNMIAGAARIYGAFTIGEEFKMPQYFDEFHNTISYLSAIENLEPIEEDSIGKVKADCPTLYPIVLEKNSALAAKVNEAKQNPQYTVKSISEDLQGEDIFKALIADYKGKPLLVDFWATWCGPCKAAMKTILPVKEELKGKANFIYITGPSSPKKTWENMIIDIHGDHYYVTEGQYSALLSQFESQGIPSYVIVDKDGNVVNKHIGYPGNDVIKGELMK